MQEVGYIVAGPMRGEFAAPEYIGSSQNKGQRGLSHLLDCFVSGNALVVPVQIMHVQFLRTVVMNELCVQCAMGGTYSSREIGVHIIDFSRTFIVSFGRVVHAHAQIGGFFGHVIFSVREVPHLVHIQPDAGVIEQREEILELLGPVY